MHGAASSDGWPGPRSGGSAAAFTALLVLLVWAPVPLASNRGWSQALLAAGILGLAFVVCLAALWRAPVPAARLALVRWPLVLLAASAAFALAQTVVLPAQVLAVLSPAAAAAWAAASADGAGSLSLDRGASAVAGVHLASLCAVLGLTAWCIDGRRRLVTACAVIVIIGVLEALTGIAAELARASGLLPGGPEEGVGGASGTYVNPNHFAGLLEMALCVSVGLYLAPDRDASLPGSGREAARRLLGFALSPRLALLAAQLVMVVAVLWSGSRGALLALAIALPLVFGLLLTPDAGRPRGVLRAGLLAGMAVVLAGAVALGGAGALGEKLAAQGLSGNRGDLLAATTAMAADFPLTGAGAGSYASVFPAYKTPQLGLLYYEHAHNDYLETLAEGGIIGAGLFFGAIAAALAGMLARGRRRRSRHARALTAGCAAAVISLLVHGLYDFNLQIPANATLLVFLLGVGVQASTHRVGGAQVPLR